MKKITPVLFLFLILLQFAPAQVELSNFTATGRGGVGVTMMGDYQTLGINAANLGFYKFDESGVLPYKKFSLGIAEGVYSTYSSALERPELYQQFFKIENLVNPKNLDAAEKKEAAQLFADNGLQMNLDVLPLGVALQPNEDVGGFSLNWRERMAFSVDLNQDMAGILFQGFNYTDYFDSTAVVNGDTLGYASLPKTFGQLFSGSQINWNWYREIGFGYGRKIIRNDKLAIYGGVGIKYLQGLAYLNVNANDEQLNAFSAITPGLGVNYGVPTPSQVTGNSFNPVGSGLGFEAGVTVVLFQKLKLGASATDLGYINWTGNVYSANDTIFNGLGSAGLNSYNVLSEIDDITGDKGLFTWSGETKVAQQTPAKFRMGASYDFGKIFSLGADAVIPLNNAPGNLKNPFIAIGGDLKPLPWFRFSSGMMFGGGTNFNIPLGVYFTGKDNLFEVGVASRDAVTWFVKRTPMLSLGVGLLRFKF
ncbi:MAG: hypothetical protein H6581_27420 [Bacteroidia bacterium]|nr:hypothetical protein [Bacteroidia bacterium]